MQKIIETKRKKKKKRLSSQADISDKPFDQKSPGHLEVGIWNCHRPKDRHTRLSRPRGPIKGRRKELYQVLTKLDPKV